MRDSIAGARIAQAAHALVGVPFRLHGRLPETGLDCVGLCLCALSKAGHAVPEPPSYTLRGGRPESVAAMIAAANFLAVHDAGEGDILLARSGPMQLHLMIAAADGCVHAHAGLGRVVHMPGQSPWPIIGRWAVPISTSPQDRG